MISRIRSDSDEQLDGAIRSAFDDIIAATEDADSGRVVPHRHEPPSWQAPRRWLAVAAAALVVVGTGSLVLVNQRQGSDDAASVVNNSAPVSTTGASTDSTIDTPDEDGPLVAASLPEDLVFRGSSSTPSSAAGEIAPLVFMWSPTATIKLDVGDPAFAADVDRPADVEEAIRTPRAVEPNFVGLDWIDANGDILVVVAEGTSLEVVAPIARRFDELQSAGQPLELIEPPQGFEVFDPATLSPTIEYRWTSDDQSRGVSVLTESTLPLAARAELRSGSTRIEQSATMFTLVNTFGLHDSELNEVEGSLTPASQVDLPIAVPEPEPPAVLSRDTRTFATEASEAPMWTIQGRLAGKDTPVSGIAEVPDEQRGYSLDPFEQLIDPSIYPVNDHGVLVAYTAAGVRSVLVEWLDDDGAVLQNTRTGEHLAEMVSAGYPPLIASTVPDEASALRLTPEAEDQLAMGNPIILTDLTPVNPPG